MPERDILSGPDRSWRLAVGLVLPVGIVLAPRFLSLGDLPLCAFRHLTRHPCPLCGGIWVCPALAQGDVLAASLINPGLMPALALAALHSGFLLVQFAIGRPLVAAGSFNLAWKWAGAALLLFWLISLLTLK